MSDTTTPKPLPPAGIRIEPDEDVEILHPVIVEGEHAEPGDVVTVDGNSASILVGQGQAKRPGSGAGGAAGAPVCRDTPFVSGTGTVGATLNCTMGNWDGEPTSYAYGWKRDGTTDVGTGATYRVAAADSGHSLTCVVTATNAAGSTIAPPSNAVAVA